MEIIEVFRVKYLLNCVQAFRLRRFFIRDVGNRKNETDNEKRPSWMMPVSHGYHAVDHQSFRSGGGSNDSDSDSVVVQREQIEDMEVWFFGVFHARIGDGVTKYMQSNLFDKKPKESHLVEKSKRIMKKAYLGARAKIRETEKQEETWKVGSASAIVINGNKLVIADMGDYRTVVCRDGEAQQISRRPKRRWSRKLIPGAIRMPKVRILACDSGIAVGTKPSRSLEFAVGSERIDSDIEFVILASNGIWEVMKHQEAVNLIRHIEDSQEAAECLAKEALTRMSRSNISCLVIRFD